MANRLESHEGEAMTPARKAELEARANDLASGPVSPYEALQALLTVEREVFKQVAKHADYLESLSRRDDLSEAEAYENIADWCRTQAKETI